MYIDDRALKKREIKSKRAKESILCALYKNDEELSRLKRT